MKAAFLYGARDLRLETQPKPQPGPDEVLVRVRAVGLCGTDIHYYRDGHVGPTTITKPLVPGHEFAGIVEEVGELVSGIRVGDHVAVDPALSCGRCEPCLSGYPNLCVLNRFIGVPPCDGGLREYVAHPGHLVFPYPKDLSFVEGALLEPLGVAIHSVDLPRLRLGDTVAVLGCGPIGLLIADLARRHGASEVFCTDILPWRVQAAAERGADLALNAHEADVVAEIKKATHGRGVDIAFEVAGALETPQQAVDIVKPGGKVVITGINAEDKIPLHSTEARRKGVTLRIVRRMKHVYPRAITLASRNMVELASLATHRYPLDQVSTAFRIADEQTPGMVKVVVEM
jgi:L-iditol 2-dehydrogenase